MRLDEIDRSLDDAPGFRVVGELTLTESGVDPIGLRQLNLDLMDATVPGINNVTRYIRPYTFMAWAWWRAARYAQRKGMTPETMHDLVARYEAMYAWSHSMVGSPFRGEVTVRRYLNAEPGTDTFTFSGPNWERYKKERTSFMAPTEYGPSIKALRFLKPEDGMFGWAEEALPALEAIDAIISASLPARFFELDPPTIRVKELEMFAEVLHVDDPTDAEVEVFRQLFYEVGSSNRAWKEVRRRKATIDLLRSILVDEGPLDIDGLRRALSKNGAIVSNEGDLAEMRKSATMLCHLQVRQLQRLATETLMLWVEVFLSETSNRSRSIDDITDHAHQMSRLQDADYANSGSVGEYMERIRAAAKDKGWPAGAALPHTGVVEMMHALQHAQYSERPRIPALVARSVAIVRAVTKEFEGRDLPEGVLNAIEGRPDRMPMGLMTRRIDALSERPLSALWREVVERWVIGQHVHWSAVRGGDGKKRLRIGLEGDGWMLVRKQPSGGFAPTPDRLWTLLALGTACGIFTTSDEWEFDVA
ncbi:hypothetical protein [Rhizobium sp. CCGE 510]|uniref:hypothetical protein n=1 Tax=Rhizobium sp. CCGE 510 TaxID=1132836 RepID=UPI00027B90B0|nr:hypothetical protein [Rhizobium sp. CCGE 510]EJT06022.1 hypothetical protein RCCGE510_06567 [Rhizobium sp. CCGE 510]